MKEHVPKTFAIRLPKSLREQAIREAEKDGVSLNQLISLAIVDKIAKIEKHGRCQADQGSSESPLEAK